MIVRDERKAVGEGLRILLGHFFPFQRAAAALRAISCRCAFVSFFARALPPLSPPFRPASCRSSGVIDAARSLASATAAGFLRFTISHLEHIGSLTTATLAGSISPLSYCLSCAVQA